VSDPVLDLLNTKNLAFTSSGRDYLIKCLNPEHDDSSPSFRIDKVTGVAHCFSCGFKTNIFKHFGLLTNHTSIKVAKLKEKLAQVRVAFDGLELPVGATPYSKSYRGISVATLKHFGAFTTYQEERLVDRLVFPIKDIRDKISVFVARHMLSDGNPRYINYPTNVEMPLYPVRYRGTFKSAVLVEGLFDMLNLYDRGLTNVACCFGTNTLQKDTSLKMLPLKAQGITHIYILFDGDKAGREGADRIKPLLEELDFVVEIIKVPDDMDPGDMDDEYVNSIKEYVNQ
jgi:DNA primase